jgi:hypothetical protein
LSPSFSGLCRSHFTSVGEFYPMSQAEWELTFT